MRSLGVELVNEGVEALLLLQAIHARRAGGLLLQREVHALVTAVLLRTAGLDAFDRDAEAKPPDRELGEIEQGVGTGEGHAIVGADGQRQSAFMEQALEGRAGKVFAGRLE